MPKTLYFEDVELGKEIGPLVKTPTKRQLVEWAGASDDFAEVHYNKDFAQQVRGLPDVIVHGRLKGAFLIQLVTDWIGGRGKLKMLSIQYRGLDFTGKAMTCKAKPTRKWEEGDDHCVECQLWAENEKGEKTIEGTAIVNLPSKNS